MKRIFIFTYLLGMFCFNAFSQTPISLDDAIRNGAREISRALPVKTRVALLNFNCESVNMSEHVLDELNSAMVRVGSLTMLDRRDLASLLEELNFQMSGEVSDETQQRIGRMLGAEMIVSGSWGILGNDYRLRMQVLEVETGRIRYSKSQTVKNEYMVQTLLTGSEVEWDFTTGQRVGTAALNLFFGIGSFVVQKDVKTGVATLIAELLGAGFVAWGIYERNYTKEYYSSDEPEYNGGIFLSNALTGVGIGVYSFGVVFGSIKAFLYHKPGAYVGMNYPDYPNSWNLAVVPDNKGNTALRLSYSMSF